jgi:triosephosphate isomerase (TIM)
VVSFDGCEFAGLCLVSDLAEHLVVERVLDEDQDGDQRGDGGQKTNSEIPHQLTPGCEAHSDKTEGDPMARTFRRPIIVGNWKMNLGGRQGLKAAQQLMSTVDTSPPDRPQLVLLPPFTALPYFYELMSSTRTGVEYGAQDISMHDDGAYTGEISGTMLVELGCRYALVGHSERRYQHSESDWDINGKIRAALRHKLSPILCVGEVLDIRREGRQVSHTVAQLDDALTNVGGDDVANSLIAYEPIWAIGTGQVATPNDAQEVCAAIRSRLTDRYGAAVGERVRILYGGSVKASASGAITAQPDIDGALVGRASLDPDELAAIWRSVHLTAAA